MALTTGIAGLDARAALRSLIDALPDNELLAARRFLEFLCGPAALHQAPAPPPLPAALPEHLPEPQPPARAVATSYDQQPLLPSGDYETGYAAPGPKAQVLRARQPGAAASHASAPPAPQALHLALAASLGVEGPDAAAAAAYVRQLQAKPLDAGAHCKLAEVYQRQRRYNQALAEYRQAASIDPNRAEFHRRMGEVYAELGNWAGAVQEYEQATRLEPNDLLIQKRLYQAHNKLRGYQAGSKR